MVEDSQATKEAKVSFIPKDLENELFDFGGGRGRIVAAVGECSQEDMLAVSKERGVVVYRTGPSDLAVVLNLRSDITPAARDQILALFDKYGLREIGVVCIVTGGVVEAAQA